LNKIGKYLSIIFIFLLVISASGCINPSNNSTGNNSQGQNANQSPNTPRINNTSAPNIIVTVAYQGSWTGNISDNTGNMTVHGTANNRYNLGPNPGTVAVTFQKTDNSTNVLSVQILQGNTVIESQSTNASFGVVSISRVF